MRFILLALCATCATTPIVPPPLPPPPCEIGPLPQWKPYVGVSVDGGIVLDSVNTAILADDIEGARAYAGQAAACVVAVKPDGGS